jgi:hypothetical protein
MIRKALLSILKWREPLQISCSEAGRKGAAIRNAKAFERKRAIVHQLCAETGQPVPLVFQ